MTQKIEIKREWETKYNTSLHEHLKFFRIAAGVLDIPEQQVNGHDQSKYSMEEWGLYVRRFGGGIMEDDFESAWLHHIRNNPHHPEYWVIPGDLGRENTIVLMPGIYVVEMIADWMASSMAYTGSWDMSKWLKEHLSRKPLHFGSLSTAKVILKSLGYDVDGDFKDNNLKPI